MLSNRKLLRFIAFQPRLRLLSYTYKHLPWPARESQLTLSLARTLTLAHPPPAPPPAPSLFPLPSPPYILPTLARSRRNHRHAANGLQLTGYLLVSRVRDRAEILSTLNRRYLKLPSSLIALACRMLEKLKC